MTKRFVGGVTLLIMAFCSLDLHQSASSEENKGQKLTESSDAITGSEGRFLSKLLPEERSFISTKSQDSLLVDQIKKDREQIDQQAQMKSARLSLYAKIEGRKELQKVPNDKSWPDNMETTFGVWKDKNRKVLMFYEVPVSESGDWRNEYIHYFDNEGHTIVFQRYSAFFNGGCTKGVAKETSMHYYDKTGRLLQKDYKLVGEKGESLEPSKCDFYYRHPYWIYETWRTAAKANGLIQ